MVGAALEAPPVISGFGHAARPLKVVGRVIPRAGGVEVLAKQIFDHGLAGRDDEGRGCDVTTVSLARNSDAIIAPPFSRAVTEAAPTTFTGILDPRPRGYQCSTRHDTFLCAQSNGSPVRRKRPSTTSRQMRSH